MRAALEKILKVKRVCVKLKVQLVDCQMDTSDLSLNERNTGALTTADQMGVTLECAVQSQYIRKAFPALPLFPHIVTALLQNKRNSPFPSKFPTHHPVVKTLFSSSFLQISFKKVSLLFRKLATFAMKLQTELRCKTDH